MPRQLVQESKRLLPMLNFSQTLIVAMWLVTSDFGLPILQLPRDQGLLSLLGPLAGTDCSSVVNKNRPLRDASRQENNCLQAMPGHLAGTECCTVAGNNRLQVSTPCNSHETKCLLSLFGFLAGLECSDVANNLLSAYLCLPGQPRHKQHTLPMRLSGPWPCRGAGRRTTHAPDGWGIGPRLICALTSPGTGRHSCPCAASRQIHPPGPARCSREYMFVI
jgi:hypothetical protein